MNRELALNLNRVALALFRATSVDDTDALSVLQARLMEMEPSEQTAVERILRNMFHTAAALPAGKGPQDFFDVYSRKLDEAEASLHRDQ
jgi:hypothetical protein